ncbi:BRCA1-associated RING domain protein 1 isoform X2 [Ooceraea biroi]|nr:BRCA1-associated RING domain protein 1 isoform X2 [Ooceraea biroi]EZA58385.1 BRCA1-associated RING domain protein [Ooceraea biroi]
MSPDHLVSGLIQHCDIIAEIIGERDLWNNTASTLNASFNTTVSQIIRPQKQSYISKNIEKTNPKGETALHTACLRKNAEKVKLLLLAGANPNTKDNAGWTPLQEVVSYGQIEICKMLLDAGASPNISGYENKRPLHEAAKSDRIEEARLLLRHGADENLCDQYGKKPIDYCYSEEMRQLLMDGSSRSLSTETSHVNQTLDKSFYAGNDKFVILASHLKLENKKLLCVTAAKHKFKTLTTYRPGVTHVIVEANEHNVTKLTLDVLFTIVRGNWLLNSEWIQLAEYMDDISDMDLGLFEVGGAPTHGIPKKARQNTEDQNPRLFNNCFFHFALQANTTYQIGDLQLTKDNLIKLVKEGEGTVLMREPNPEDLNDMSQLIPFHIANDSSHPLHKCTHYVIYMPGKGEPLIKYNMPHIKSLPLVWLIECIEKFTLINPVHLGLS